MQRFLVTGANRGIGLAIAEALVQKGAFVFLGSRDAARGEAAKQELVANNAAYAGLLEVVQLDVTDAASIAAAAEQVASTCGEDKLAGLVNNAGGTRGMLYTTHEDWTYTMDLNYHGLVEVTKAFLPLLKHEGGRIVMVSSGAAPSFVAACSAEKQAFFTNPAVTLEEIDALVEEARQISSGEDSAAGFAAAGLSDGSGYGLSKASINSYAMSLAAAHPTLKVNSCTPGFIETDLTRPMAQSAGKTPEEMGMKTTDAVRRVIYAPACTT